ncbi:lipopolysaccharide biosynthesis protein [Raineyella fluvialis]|uniref:Membrane protein involved in the export of O-antigen and teichoic acid n=1 Tax=Raineyella fluvialis TaxID=2662261 RepID=A0A5Q2FFC1_9ACTN|nr:hypothetical protein [Raineyella fluvialis]QGF23405.1 hypothetical protein Rai3103_06700 [Raineyella fluvialis]
MMGRRAGVARNITTTYVARLASILTLFVLFPAVARVVPASEYGVYLLTAGMASLFSVDLGMAGSATRYVSEAHVLGDDSRMRSVLAGSAVFFVGVGIFSSGALVVTIVFGWKDFHFTPEQASIGLVAGAAAVAQVALGSIAANERAILTGLGRIDLANWILIAQAFTRFGATLVVLGVSREIIWVAVVDASAAVIGTFLFVIIRRMVLRTRFEFGRDFNWAVLRHMWGLSRDMLVMSLAATVILYAGGVVVGLTSSAVSVALFAAGQRIYQAAKEIPNSLTAPLLPIATANHLDGAGRNKWLYLDGTRFSLALVLASLPPVCVYMATLVEWWLGPNYSVAADVAMLLTASVILNCLHLVAVPVMGGQESLGWYSVLHGMWAVSALGLGFLFSSEFGAVGMALAVALPLVILEPLYVGRALRKTGGLGSSS